MMLLTLPARCYARYVEIYAKIYAAADYAAVVATMPPRYYDNVDQAFSITHAAAKIVLFFAVIFADKHEWLPPPLLDAATSSFTRAEYWQQMIAIHYTLREIAIDNTNRARRRSKITSNDGEEEDHHCHIAIRHMLRLHCHAA